MNYHEFDLRRFRPSLTDSYTPDRELPLPLKSWRAASRFLLFAYKEALRGGGWSDLQGITTNKTGAMKILLSLHDHPYGVTLVDIRTFHIVPIFREYYVQIWNQHQKKDDFLANRNKSINISKFELLILQELSRLDKKDPLSKKTPLLW